MKRKGIIKFGIILLLVLFIFLSFPELKEILRQSTLPQFYPAEPFQGFNTKSISPQEFYVINISGKDINEILKYRALQGLENRAGPKIYLVKDEKDLFWLSTIKGAPVFVKELNYSYPEIKYDPGSRLQRAAALTLAGVYKAIPTKDAEDPILDLTKMSKKEIYSIMLEAWELTSHNAISFIGENPDIAYADFAVQQKLFVSPFALSEPSPLPLKYESRLEKRISMKIFSELSPDCAMVGYNINPKLIGEYETVYFLSKHGCFSIPVPKVPNLSFTSNLPKRKFKQNHPPPRDLTLENKTYVAFVFSDGDNIEVLYKYYKNVLYDSKVPMAWSINPFIAELSPNMMGFYYENSGKYFVAPPSGAGYTYPTFNKYLGAYLEHTQYYMNLADLKQIWVLDLPVIGYHPLVLAAYSKISNGVLAGYGEHTLKRNHYYSTPITFTSIYGKYPLLTLLQIKLRLSKQPDFILVAVPPWSMSPRDVEWIAKNLGDDYEIVRIDEFMVLLEQARQTPQ